jgi:hypothetical protein
MIQGEVQEEHYRRPVELESLKHKINDQTYLYDAINCLAMLLSNEILNTLQGGIIEYTGRIQAQGVSTPESGYY